MGLDYAHTVFYEVINLKSYVDGHSGAKGHPCYDQIIIHFSNSGRASADIGKLPSFSVMSKTFDSRLLYDGSEVYLQDKFALWL